MVNKPNYAESDAEIYNKIQQGKRALLILRELYFFSTIDYILYCIPYTVILQYTTTTTNTMYYYYV